MDRPYPERVHSSCRGYLVFGRHDNLVPQWTERGAQDLLLAPTADLEDIAPFTFACLDRFFRLRGNTRVRTEQVIQTRDQRPTGLRPHQLVVGEATPEGLVTTLKRVLGFAGICTSVERLAVPEPPRINGSHCAWPHRSLESQVRFCEERL